MAEIASSKIPWLLDKTYPKIGNRPVSKITAQEIVAVLRFIDETGRYEGTSYADPPWAHLPLRRRDHGC
ncbi:MULTISPECIES: phage integrase central domain-containing protein [Sphingobium]|uniref:Phage integrase central domain-containing protein n=1 Tax=Sphingobium fuliginis (strain ATCC 27551) TaxID=336203 RepID=A0ABQ1FC16_SPHSA|nr:MULTISPECIES: hypothetical protein [Sphingobium]AJR23060.1 hypothetical protein TZ53_04070 [Sphingobium sp. YBL2]UXC90182.1 hypothetical protein EGM87_14135 [Sphingobium sp. RSMS]WDA34497.1 hypothetical protein PO876_13445 [Sphingobium sp. YC-XJ3]GGA05934.1 hypothetical protein GCM10019071_40640 [Sphingobium fuliginis]